MSNPINRHNELQALLERLKLAAMAQSFADLALKAAKEGLSHEVYLHELATREEALRHERRTERPALQLQIERLKKGAFLEQAINVVAVGKPGVGKSHVGAAVGHEWVLAGHAVLWTPTSSLVQRLLAAKRDLRLPQELAKLDKFACVILDDIGYVQQDRDEMEVLFTFLAERYEHKSVLITTNLVFSEWERIFKNPMTTMAAIDRVIHHCVILDMMAVDSYRAHQANQLHLQELRETKPAALISQ